MDVSCSGTLGITLCDLIFSCFLDGKLPAESLLLTFESIAKDDEFLMATRELYVGCVRTMAVSQKKVRNL
jgi:hypothetical protein